jgi:hypothetical protein
MTGVLSTARIKVRTLVLLAICGLLAIAAAVVGIDDNLPGVALAFLAATAFVMAFVHTWSTARQFKRLLYVSALAFVVFGVLHNGFEAIASRLGGPGLLPDLLNAVGAALFLIATLICAPGILVGAVGALVMSIRDRRRPRPGPTAAA